MDSRYRRYCITSFDEKPPKWDPEKCKFIIYQKECCPETKKEHYQCYVEFKNKEKGVVALNILEIDKGWFTAASGTKKQNVEYCTKEDTRVDLPVSYGDSRGQGYRCDLDEFYEELIEGKSTKEILHRHGGNALRYVNLISRSRAILFDWDEKENIMNERQEYERAKQRAVPHFRMETFRVPESGNINEWERQETADWMFVDDKIRTAQWKPM